MLAPNPVLLCPPQQPQPVLISLPTTSSLATGPNQLDRPANYNYVFPKTQVCSCLAVLASLGPKLCTSLRKCLRLCF